MATYLVVKTNNEEKRYLCKDSANPPRLRVYDSYLPLSTNKQPGLVVKINGTEYSPLTGNKCTYVVDTGVSYEEEVEYGATCLSPTTFTPTKTGWIFLGWREDTVASSTVLSTKTMGDNPITLYAVFKASVTLTKYNASNTASTESKDRIYNNANITNPTFTLTQGALSGWNKAGWTNNASGYSATVADGGTVTLSANATYYTLYTVSITVTKYVNGSGGTQTESKNRVANVHNATTYSNPSFTLTEPDLSGWTKYGWADAADFTADVGNGGSVTLTASKTYYALYYQSIKVTYYNNSSTAGSTSKNRNVRAGSSWSFSNPTFNLTVYSVSGWSIRGWSTSSSANAGITYNSGANFTRDSSCTLYASWSKTCTVSYNGNGNTGGSTASNSGTAYRGYKGDVTNASVKLQSNGFTRTRSTFSKWALNGTSGTQYSAGTNISINSNVTMYAIWTYNAWNPVKNGVLQSGTTGKQVESYGSGVYAFNAKADTTWGYGIEVYNWKWEQDQNNNYFWASVTFNPQLCSKITVSAKVKQVNVNWRVKGWIYIYAGNTLLGSSGETQATYDAQDKTMSYSLSKDYSSYSSITVKVKIANDGSRMYEDSRFGGGILNVYCGT